MKYMLSIISLLISTASFADDTVLYYEANGQCTGLYQTPPSSGCNGTTVSSVGIPNGEGVFSGYYVDGVQIIDANGNVNSNVVEVLAGLGNNGAEQTAVAEFLNNDNTGIDYGPWNIYFYGGAGGSTTPLMVKTYKRNPKWNAGSGNATYIGLMMYQTGIQNGIVRGWCSDSNLTASSCFTDAGNCISGCDGRLQIILPWDASGNKSYYALLDCDRGYHQVGYACVADAEPEFTNPVSKAECQVTGGIWDNANSYCKYLINWHGGSCSEYKDNYYIAGRKNFVRCGSHSTQNAGLGGKLQGWCVDASLNSGCTDDTYGTVVIPARARGVIDLYAKVICASAFNYNANTGKCDRVSSDFGSWDLTRTCNSSQLWGCNTAAKCSQYSGVWDENNNLCASQSFVASNNNSIWPTHDCSVTHTCIGQELTPEEDCLVNGGTWSGGKCTYTVSFVQNVQIPYQERRPVCTGEYIAGEMTPITCDTTRTAGTFISWCLDDQLKSACNAATHSKTVIIPPTAKGHLVYYGKWECNDKAWQTNSYCVWHIYETTHVLTTPATYVPICTSDDTSGCMNDSQCTYAGGTWDSIAQICYKAGTLSDVNSALSTYGDPDRTISLKFSCGTGDLRWSGHPLPAIDGKFGDLFQVPDAYEYCKGKPYTGPNFIGWNVSRGAAGDNNTNLSWDSGIITRIPKTNTATRSFYTVTAAWERGDEHSCPDDYSSVANPGLHSSGGTSGCPASKCGEQHYYGDWPSCQATYGLNSHKKFDKWCKTQNWTVCSTNPFADKHNTSEFWGVDYYDKYDCIEGYTLNSNKECVCTKELKPITFDTTGSSGGLSSACPKESCGDTPLIFPPSSCNVATMNAKKFVAWCTDESRTNCPEDLQFVGGNTYYAKYECLNNYHDDGNGNCVKN